VSGFTKEACMTDRRCDNPDCDNVLGDVRGRQFWFGNSLFCSSKCKAEYFLWVEAIARQRPEITIRPPHWAM
jgi:hypothetical protein